MSELHRLTEPSAWATSLDTVSFSSLEAVERCPRQWQLRNSSWPGFSRLPTPPNAAAIEGTIVHEVLDLVFREMAFAGLPPTGSAAFRDVLRGLDVVREIQRRIDEAHAELDAHPRRASLRLPRDARALYNRVAQLFQREYAEVYRRDLDPVSPASRAADTRASPLDLLRARGVLTEFPLRHPALPVRGVVDLLRRDESGTHVVDFKTGSVKPEHEAQLALYALLWWRSTGELPVSASLRHPRGRAEFTFSAQDLTTLEASLIARVDAARAALSQTPAPALPGPRCASCGVRPFCDVYWGDAPSAAALRGAGDAEVQVPDVIEPHGFVAERAGHPLAVVWEDDGGAVHGPFVAGETLRVLGATPRSDGSLLLSARSEVFHRAPSAVGNGSKRVVVEPGCDAPDAGTVTDVRGQ